MMSNRTRQRWSRLRRLRGALAGAALGGLMLATIPASPASAAGPRFVGTSVCTPSEPYFVRTFLEGFAANDSLRALISYDLPSPEKDFVVDISDSTDASGNSPLDLDFFDHTSPHKIGLLMYHDRDGSGSYTTGDDQVINVVLNIDRPCTDLVAQPK